MTELELAKFRDDTYNRLVDTLDMSHTQANFVIALERHTHFCLGAALLEINDFLDSRGL